MHQHPNETAADFAHRFCEIQHELDIRIPKIHCDLELIYAFLIKLREDISRELFSREFNFKTLQELITAAQRYETRSTLGKSPSKQELSDWQPAEVNIIGPSRKKTFHLRGHPIPNHVMAVILKVINIKRVNLVINQQAKVVVQVGANHTVMVTPQVRFAFILIEMSHQPVNCQPIYAVMVININV